MRKNNGFGATRAIHHRMDDIEIFPITKEQLDALERGAVSDLFLEIGLCLVSVFASFLCSLIVLDFTTSPKAFDFFMVICIVSGISSIIMFLLWWRNRKDKNKLITKIKSQKIEE